MIKKNLFKLAIASSILFTQAQAIEHNFIMNIMPGSILASSDIEGFTNTVGGPSETIDGYACFSPNLSLGYGMDIDYFSFDVAAGYGVLTNAVFTTFYIQAEATVYLTTLQKGFMIGPFVRYMDISDPEWSTDNLAMTGTSANAYGISMMTGGKKVKFKVNISKLSGADIAVTGRNGYIPSSSILSLDGTSIELGLALRF